MIDEKNFRATLDRWPKDSRMIKAMLASAGLAERLTSTSFVEMTNIYKRENPGSQHLLY